MSRKFLLAVLVVGTMTVLLPNAAFAAVSAGNTGWNWGNPLPQGNTLRELDSAGQRVYAGGESGTLLRSNDGGNSWTSVRTGLLDSIATIRVLNPDSVVFAGECALRRTDDGGATVKRLAWGPSDEDCNFKISSFYFPTQNLGYLLLENGDVLSTADGGESWSKKTSVPGSRSTGGQASVNDIWFTGPSTGVVNSGGTVYLTSDGATSWSPVSAGGSLLRGFTFASPTVGYAVGDDNRVLTSGDGGASWADVAAAPPAGPNDSKLSSIDCADTQNCVATRVGGTGVVRTEDGGASWGAVSPLSSGTFAAVFTAANNLVAVGGGGGTVVSTDKGATWTAISSAASGRYQKIAAQSDSVATAVGGNGTVARTTNGGASWQSVGVSTSNNVVAATFPSATRGYVLDSAGVLLRSNNAGGSWQFLDTGVSTVPREMITPTSSTVVLIGPKGVRTSSNDGNDFAGASGKNLKKAALSRADQAGSALFAYGAKAIFVSNNAAKKWKAFKKPAAAKTISKLDMVSSKAGYVLDTRGELYFTRNAGKKWTRIETTGAGSVRDMAFGSVSVGYLTDWTGRVLRTLDSGKTWSRQYPFFDSGANSPLLIAAPSGRKAFMAVLDTNRLFVTDNAGTGGAPSTLTIKASSKRVRKGTTIKITGKLSPVNGGERVAVLARVSGAKGGTRWTTQERTVSANGTFTTSWRITKGTTFIARWSGSASHDGDGAPAVKVVLRKR